MKRPTPNPRAALDAMLARLPPVSAIERPGATDLGSVFVVLVVKPNIMNIVLTHRSPDGYLGAAHDMTVGDLSPAEVFTITRDPADRKGRPTWLVTPSSVARGGGGIGLYVTGEHVVETARGAA